MTNEQIAIDVMQWKIIEYDNGVTDMVFPDGEVRKSGSVDNYYDFLNCHNAAMMVVEKMRGDGYTYEVDEAPNRAYHAEFYPVNSVGNFGYESTDYSLCHAICEAALKAKGK